MNISTRTKQAIAAVAITAAAGVAASGAFTATGLTNAAPTQFIGGTVSQSVSGSELSSVTYGFVDATNSSVNLITLAFSNAAADGIVPTAVPSGGSGGTFDCAAINGGATTCSFVPAAAQTGYIGLTNLAITVES